MPTPKYPLAAHECTDDGGGNTFADDDGSVFESDIVKLAAAGIAKGCNPPTSDRFCPDARATRRQIAAFLVRALTYNDDGGVDLFTDDDDSIFETDIDNLATAGVTRGCNPPVNDRLCPTSNVTRGGWRRSCTALSGSAGPTRSAAPQRR